MRSVTSKKVALFLCLVTGVTVHSGRSPWRPKDPQLPELTARWSDGSTPYIISDHCLEYHAIFCKFDRTHFFDHLLPNEPIPYRNAPEKTVSGDELSNLAEEVMREIQQGKKEYTHFKVLKKSDFNLKLASGLIILKYKDYPFILKLFLKTPKKLCKAV